MFMKEFGGYIEFEYFHGNEYHDKAIKLNCGRNCLAYLIEAYDIKKIYLPYFLCSSVTEVCKKYTIQIEYYNITHNFVPVLPKELDNNSWLYLVNFYGQLNEDLIRKIKEKTDKIILDNAQAFFIKPIDDIPTIYTCRKFFGVADGAYLYSNKNISKTLEQDFSYNRMNFLLGRFEKSANEFYFEYSANNKFFMNEPIKQMSKITKNIMKGIDYDYVINKRNQNFSYLSEKLSSINKLNIKFSVGPFAYPLYLENGSEIRKKLQEKKVYIPTLWPDVFDLCNETMLEYQYAKNILPIPVDQRYGIEDMKYILEFVLKEI